MGRDCGVNMPSSAQLVSQRTATEMELSAAREYLDSLDDTAIWYLLRMCRATATQWDNPNQHQLEQPSPLADCLVEGVRYLHPVSDIILTWKICHRYASIHTTFCFLSRVDNCTTDIRGTNSKFFQH